MTYFLRVLTGEQTGRPHELVGISLESYSRAFRVLSKTRHLLWRGCFARI